MKIAIGIAIVIAAATVGIVATPDSRKSATPTTPDPISAPPVSSTVVTEVTTVTVTNPAQPESLVKIDNRLGYGALKLHMTPEEAVAAGLEGLELEPGAGACSIAENVAISRKYGIERITLPAESTTSLGIGVGSTVADVKKAYPNAKPFRGGFSVELNDTGGYTFSVTSKLNGPFADTDKVEAVKLMASLVECPNAAL
ncbi:hypothetical protein G7043_22600 [Lentzea sp. NEAU-D13]|uniref:Uncharacterized protein n=1 Tax=Lentzea alba TaxID=2714351 RepID=A0A7C9RVH9_9PSEU|nr:hypothetical protein [Lentzea alba]NGY61722.1 hypothetical protein [Lentzea alba]